MNAEEAIETLVKSYESSLMRHQVWRQVSRISEKVCNFLYYVDWKIIKESESF